MRNNIITLIAISFSLMSATAMAGFGFRTSEDDVFTLYRSSAVSGGSIWRVHIATFDASDGKAYNLENCETAKSLFENQQGVTIRYWCEKGYFRK